MPFKLFNSTKKRSSKVVVSTLVWRDFAVKISRKSIKSIRLKVAGSGELNVSCPHFIGDVDIFAFLEERQDWILKHTENYAHRLEKHAQSIIPGHVQLWGEQRPIESLRHSKRQNVDLLSEEQLQQLKQKALRDALKTYLEKAVPVWQDKMEVNVNYWNVRKMTSKWGSCNITRKRIWLNTQLASFPEICAEMVLVHELTHFYEPYHNKRFYGIMDHYFPEWREADKILKESPLYL